jgi:hypothetical protein
VKTANPLLVSIAETEFQMSLPEKDINALIRDGEILAVKVRGQVLVVYESLTAFTRRASRNNAIRGNQRRGVKAQEVHA